MVLKLQNVWNFDNIYNANVDVTFKAEFQYIMNTDWNHIINDGVDKKLSLLLDIMYDVYKHFSSIESDINPKILWLFIYDFIEKNKTFFV